MKMANLQFHRYFLTLSVMLLCMGCTQEKTSSPYTTVNADPRRNTDIARQSNARAIELIGQAKWTEAEAVLKEALNADVTFGPAHNNLGQVYFKQNKLYLAAWEFQYAAKLMPFAAEPRNNLGLVLEQTGKLDDAVSRYDESLAIQPDNPEIIGNAARARLRRGDRDQRVKELLTLLVSHDERAEWQTWARRELILLRPAPPTTQGEPVP